MIVRFENGKYFRKLLSFLDQDGELDSHLAGYFEKLLEMFFRRETMSSIDAINDGNMQLFSRFLHHIDNYSIMQIVQRLMLPHIPFFVNENENEATANFPQCNWAATDEVTEMLCRRMLSLPTRSPDGSEDGDVITSPDVAVHISDLLITVIQLSPPGSALLTSLCTNPNLDALLTTAFASSESSTDTVRLSTISVIESMISRLYESLSIVDETAAVDEATMRILSLTEQCILRLLTSCFPYFPDIRNALHKYAESENCSRSTSQSRLEFMNLGHVGLQLVKLIEALVRWNDLQTDVQLCSSGCISVVIDLLFSYPLNSLLHLSVQRVLLMIVEGGSRRRVAQEHIYVECRLLQRIVDFFADISKASKRGNPHTPGAGDAQESKEPAADELDDTKNNNVALIAGCRNPLVGHLIIVAQAICSSLQTAEAEADAAAEAKAVDVSISSDVDKSVDLEGVTVSVAESPAGQDKADISGQSEDTTGVPSNSEPDTQSLKVLLANNGLLDVWTNFQTETLTMFVGKYMSEFGGIEELRNMPPPAPAAGGFTYTVDDFPNNNNVEEDFEFEEFDNATFKWDAFAVSLCTG
jgi:hypothetical protein